MLANLMLLFSAVALYSGKYIFRNNHDLFRIQYIFGLFHHSKKGLDNDLAPSLQPQVLL